MKFSTFMKWAVPIGLGAAAFFTGGASLLGLGGSGSGFVSGAVNGVANGILGTAASAAGAGGMSGAALLGLAGVGSNLATGIYGAHTQSSSAKDAANAQIAAAQEQAKQQQAAQEKQLAFLQQQEQQRRREAQQAQDLNLAEYNQDTANEYDRFNKRERNLTSYRNVGEGASTMLGDLLGLDPALTRRAYEPQTFTPLPSPNGTTGAAVAGVPAQDYDAALAAAKAGLTPSSASLDQVIARLKAKGITASRATHANGTLPSDDKLILPGGMIKDLIYNVGAPDARWM